MILVGWRIFSLKLCNPDLIFEARFEVASLVVAENFKLLRGFAKCVVVIDEA